MLYLIAFVGGVLAIVSPCILPVLPFVFARADQPFRRSGLPLLAGMALTFVLVGALATAAGGWIVRANEWGRIVAMVAFAVFGAALVFPGFADALARPAVRLGAKVQRREVGGSAGSSLALGAATGLLWTPCAGPILGLVLAGAATTGSSARGAVLLAAFAAGSASALALALLAGRRVFAIMKRALGAEMWLRRVLGVAVLAGVAGIALGWDTGVLARTAATGAVSTTKLEQRLVDRLHGKEPAPAQPSMQMQPSMAMSSQAAQAAAAADDGDLAAFASAARWFNGPAQSAETLRGKVVMVDFWTYSCINCLRAIPYVEAWAQKYKRDGLVVVGVHTPEFAFERDPANVERAVKDLKITYPVALDNSRAIWTAFHNQYWPAHYFIDRQGRIRGHHFGEGDYEESEQMIQALLAEGTAAPPSRAFVHAVGAGVQAAPDVDAIQSPETYVGYGRQENYASPQPLARDRPAAYTAPPRLTVNRWGLDGMWTVGAERALLSAAPGRVIFRFHARDLHLVLGPGPSGAPIRFRVSIDGAPPLEDRGVDVDAQGAGRITTYRLYQLIRQRGAVEDRTFQIEFLDPGAQVYAFTFG